MDVGLALEIHASIDHRSSAIHSLGDEIEALFRERSYGVGLEHLFIGIILTMPGDDPLHPVRRFRFRKTERVKLQRGVLELHNSASYDVKPDFDFVRDHSGDSLRLYLSRLLFESTDVLITHTGKFPDFDVAAFRSDFSTLAARPN